MASSPITLWQIWKGKKWKQWQIFSSWAPKSLWMVTSATKLEDACFLEGRPCQASLNSVLKSKHITLPTKVHYRQSHSFPVVIYGCESWTIKKAECQRTDAFELWCWRTRSRVPWTARRSSQSITREINPEYSMEGLLLKLKLQYFGHWCKQPTHWKRPWCWEKLKAKGEEGRRGWDGWMVSLIQWTWTWGNYRRWWGTGRPGVL